MISAQDLRQKAELAVQNKIERTLTEIKRQLESAAEDGYTGYRYHNQMLSEPKISQQITQQLQESGFVVYEEVDMRSGDWHYSLLIRW